MRNQSGTFGKDEKGNNTRPTESAAFGGQVRQGGKQVLKSKRRAKEVRRKEREVVTTFHGALHLIRGKRKNKKRTLSGKQKVQERSHETGLSGRL